MDLSNVFPSFNSKSLAIIITKIFLHVSYNDNLRRFRLVSSGWRDFFDQEIHSKPHLRSKLERDKQLVHAWTKRPPKKMLTVENVPVEGGNDRRVSAHVSGDYMFVNRGGRGKTLVYKDLDLVGCIVSNNDPTGFFLPSFVPCNGFFVDLNQFIPVNPSQAKLKCYRNQEEAELMQDEVPDEKQFFLRELDLPSFPAEGRTPLALKSVVGEDKLFLICMEKLESESKTKANKIVIVNVKDGTEKMVPVSKLGTLPHPYLFRAVDIMMDKRDLVIAWKVENFLQFIDYERGEEVWIKDNMLTDENNLPSILIEKSDGLRFVIVSYSMISVANQRNCYEIYFYENRSGQLVTGFSIPTPAFTFQGIAPAGHILLLIARDHKLHLMTKDGIRHVYLGGRPSWHKCDNVECQIRWLCLVGVVRERVVLLTGGFECNANALIAYDMLEEVSVPIDVTKSAKYVLNALRDEVVCAKPGPNMDPARECVYVLNFHHDVKF